MKILEFTSAIKSTKLAVKNTILEGVEYSYRWPHLETPMNDQITRMIYYPIRENMWEYANYNLIHNRRDLTVIFRRVIQS